MSLQRSTSLGIPRKRRDTPVRVRLPGRLSIFEDEEVIGNTDDEEEALNQEYEHYARPHISNIGSPSIGRVYPSLTGDSMFKRPTVTFDRGFDIPITTSGNNFTKRIFKLLIDTFF